MKKRIKIVSFHFNLRDTDRAYTIYKYFIDRNYDVEVLCGDFDHNSKEYKNYNLNGVNAIHVLKYNKNMSIKRFVSNIKFSFDAKKCLGNKDFDILYIVAPPNITGFICKNETKRTKSRLVIDVFDLNPEGIPLCNKYSKLLYIPFKIWSNFRDRTIEQSNIFIATCNYYLTTLKLTKNSKNWVIPLCKGDFIIDKVSTKNFIKLNIVYLGALTHSYDFESLIKICTSLKSTIKLHIIGDGERREWLLDNLNNNGINYEFYGRIYDDEEKLKIMSNCQFGFNGFKKETRIALSYKSMEYMCYGLALINSCKEDTWNLVEKYKIGINYNSEHLDKLITILQRIDIDTILSMRNNSRECYRINFTFQKYKEKMDEIFSNI